MSVPLFRFKGVPDDEADEIRQLLAEHQFDVYETPGSQWGFSHPILWLRDEEQLEQAKAVLAQYQAQRQMTARADYEQLQAEGRQPGVWGSLRKQPLRFLFYVALIALILYLSLSPFIRLGE